MIEVVQTTSDHVIALKDNIREQDACEISKFGISVRKALWRSYKNAIYTKTVVIDGEVAAIWGLGGVVLGEKGNPWLLTAPLVEKHFMPLVLLYRNEVREMLEYFPILENHVDAAYTKSVRLLELMGFTLDEPKPIPGIKSKALFRRFELRSPSYGY